VRERGHVEADHLLFFVQIRFSEMSEVANVCVVDGLVDLYVPPGGFVIHFLRRIPL